MYTYAIDLVQSRCSMLRSMRIPTVGYPVDMHDIPTPDINHWVSCRYERHPHTGYSHRVSCRHARHPHTGYSPSGILQRYPAEVSCRHARYPCTGYQPSGILQTWTSSLHRGVLSQAILTLMRIQHVCLYCFRVVFWTVVAVQRPSRRLHRRRLYFFTHLPVQSMGPNHSRPLVIENWFLF